MFERTARESMLAEAPTVDNGNVGRLVEMIQKARLLDRETLQIEEAHLRNAAEKAKVSAEIKEMIKVMYQDDPVVKNLADAFFFVLGGDELKANP